MIRVGIIGAGFMGRMHFDAYQKLAGRVEVAALCDQEADRRAGDWSRVGGNLDDGGPVQRDFRKVKPYTDYRAMLADAGVDLVDICAPTFLHSEIAIAALRAGKHVLCEKPMARSVAECDAMLAAAEKTDRKFMIAQCTRFWPQYVYLKQAIDERRFGPLKALHLRRQAARPDYTMNNWIMDPALSGGMVLDLHIHDLDYALYLFGRPRAIHLLGVNHPRFGVDRVYALWHYDTGVPVLLEGFWDMPGGFPFNAGFSAVFAEAAVQWDLVTRQPLTVYRPGGGGVETPPLPEGDGYFREIQYFLDCIEKNQEPKISTPRQSRDGIALALAEAEAVRSGRPEVKLA